MKVIVRSVDSSSSELHVEDGETWGRLCQRFVETRLPHPPRLLQLLASLHPDERLGRYRFRYGDGNSTVIEPTWSISGHNSSAPIISSSSSDVEVEANVTLRCDSRECSPREKVDCEEWDDNSKITMRLHVEKVGGEDNDDDDDESSGVLPFLSHDVTEGGGKGGEWVETTRTPFPVDDGETSVLRVREHVRFAGVVDKFSISKYLESDDREEEEGGTEVDTQGPATEEKGKTRKQKKEKRNSTESEKKSNEDDEGKKEEQQSAAKKANRSKKAKLVASVAALNAAEETTDAKKSNTRSKKKGSKETPQKKGTSATMVSPTPTSTPGKEGNDKPKDQGAATADKRDDDDGTKGPVAEKPKRPLNAYMLFGKEMRPAIKEGSPDASPQEIIAKIGEAYRALGDDEKKRYTDAADAAMAKFKREHGDGALATKRSSAKKKKKTKPTTDDVDGDGKAAAAPPPAEKRRTLSGDAFALIPPTPAEGLPEGWTTKNVPRRNGKQCDRYWFSPARGYRFRSMAEVKRFRESLDRVVVVGGGGEELESAAMESYLGEKKGGGSAGKRKKRKASVGDDGGGAGKKRKTAAGPSAVKEEGDGNVGDEGSIAKEDGKIETAGVAVTQEEGDENADKDGAGTKDAIKGESTAGDGKEDGSNGNAADDGVVAKDAGNGKSSKKKKRKNSTGAGKKKDKGDGNAGDDGVEAEGVGKGKSGGKKKRKSSKKKDDKVIVKAEENTISDHEDEIPDAWDA